MVIRSSPNAFTLSETSGIQWSDRTDTNVPPFTAWSGGAGGKFLFIPRVLNAKRDGVNKKRFDVLNVMSESLDA